MIGVQGHIDGLAGGKQNTGKLRRDPRGIGDRNTRMQANDFHMIDGFEPGHDVREPSRRQGQRIAAGEDYFPDPGLVRDIAHRGGKRLRCKISRTVWPDDRAAKAEPAIDRADVEQFQERAIWVAVDNAFDRAECEIAGRIGHFVRPLGEFGQVWNKLAGDWVGGIGGVDQARNRAGNSNGVDRGDPLDRVPFCLRHETGSDQIGGVAQGSRRLLHRSGVPC